MKCTHGDNCINGIIHKELKNINLGH